MSAASAGEMPKKPASNPYASVRNPPWRETVRPGSRRSAEQCSAMSNRSAGTTVTLSVPDTSRSQNSCGPFAPGNAQPIPTTATAVRSVVREARTAFPLLSGMEETGLPRVCAAEGAAHSLQSDTNIHSGPILSSELSKSLPTFPGCDFDALEYMIEV